MADNNKKSMTIDDLAVMVAKGFENVETRLGGVETELGDVKTRLGSVETRLGGLEHKVEALNSNVNNYLELSEKRYSELKQRDALLAKWLKLIADKAGVPIDVSQLEKI
ncbi:MAG TPA: hypothetical protein VHA30_02270 [Patescibacteria group bacterium]|nr:hypothetical protein [Patescibacteria group bacterium]